MWPSGQGVWRQIRRLLVRVPLWLSWSSLEQLLHLLWSVLICWHTLVLCYSLVCQRKPHPDLGRLAQLVRVVLITPRSRVQSHLACKIKDVSYKNGGCPDCEIWRLERHFFTKVFFFLPCLWDVSRRFINKWINRPSSFSSSRQCSQTRTTASAGIFLDINLARSQKHSSWKAPQRAVRTYDTRFSFTLMK